MARCLDHYDIPQYVLAYHVGHDFLSHKIAGHFGWYSRCRCGWEFPHKLPTHEDAMSTWVYQHIFPELLTYKTLFDKDYAKACGSA